jgi:hypothetical protein
MTTSKQDILNNTAVNADFSATAFDEKLAGQIAETLLLNTSIQSINFSYSNFDDIDFNTIKNSLISRNLKLVELNLDGTEITSGSVNNILELMEKSLVKRVLLFYTKDIYDNEKNKKRLSECADSRNIYISFEHPKKRMSVKTLFEDSSDEQKDPNSLYQKISLDHEAKEQNDAFTSPSKNK